jgi:hypothetical protein
MQKESVYLETTIISYYTARPSRDIIVSGRQQITIDWIDKHSQDFHLLTSALVIQECSAGDGQAVARRLSIVEKMALLEMNEHAEHLSEHLLMSGVIPKKCAEDALHIALATVHGIDFLLTWNCKHIANAHIQRKLELAVRQKGYELPVICTPEALMEDTYV